MPQEPKKSPQDTPCSPTVPTTDTWENDQKEHDYYYDDSHGYVVYTGEDDDDDDEPETDAKHG